MTIKSQKSPDHPGVYIKNHIIPKGMAVKKVAQLIDVGRPAVSKLLHGKAALTPEMAFRFAKAFGANPQELLKMQAEYNEFDCRERAKEFAVRTYVPDSLGIHANQIAAWAESVSSRSILAALLRRLVHSTGINLSKVDFPAYDNAQRHGWDGYVLTDTVTPWIPSGISGWEFGCNENPAKKAEEDYQSRTTSIPPHERKDITFVFVTPQNWNGKEGWALKKRELGEWKAVIALDASDLEQWLEQSIATQAWFAEILGIPVDGINSLENVWKEWAEATNPHLSKIFFRTAVEMHKEKLQNWLSNPLGQPFVITANSEIEALAFLACAFESLGVISGQYYDQTLVLRTVGALKRLAASMPNFLAVVASIDVERESVGLQNSHGMLIIRRHNNIPVKSDISLDLVDDQTFREALASMGLPIEDYHQYVRKTGYSLTVLRRQLSPLPAIREPAWSKDNTLARKLIPLTFAGVWNSSMAADCEIMQILEGSGHVDIECSVTDLLAVEDVPVWSLGKFRGVVSKIDAFFATNALVTKSNLDNFFFAAKYVLSEKDPALDLPVDKQWAAALYGKVRDHSKALREGICETLVLLAIHGDNLFRERLGIDVTRHINEIVKGLLIPLDSQTWATQKVNLSYYAEAAPEIFLDILEEDLASSKPKVHELLLPADNTPFSGCSRTGLLWALEILAWKPERLMRVSSILAKLATVRIDDNWSNKPEVILESIFLALMPQTAATVDERNSALEILCERFPEVGWRLCVAQFAPRLSIGYYNTRPRWRNEAQGAGQSLRTENEIRSVIAKALQLALAWPSHTEKTLGDLVENISRFDEKGQETIWGLIKTWAATGPSDIVKCELRERIRKFAFTRQANIRGITRTQKDRAREAYNLLCPADLIMKYLWLFAQDWVDESVDELSDSDFSYDKHEAQVNALRKEALQEIWNVFGCDGIFRLCMAGDAAGVVGCQLADGVIRPEKYEEFLNQLIDKSTLSTEKKIDNLLNKFLSHLSPDVRNNLIGNFCNKFLSGKLTADDKLIRILKCSPFRAETWEHLNALSEELCQRYWNESYVRWERQNEDEFNIIIDNLLKAKRPCAAFNIVRMNFDKVETGRLVALLRAMITSNNELIGHFRFSQYEFVKVFKSLQKRPEISLTELAELEFLHIDVLEHSDYRMPALEKEISKKPYLFMQLVSLVYPYQDGEIQATVAHRVSDNKRIPISYTALYSCLHNLSLIPGTMENGSIDGGVLLQWINDVRGLARSQERTEIADYAIGGILAKCPPDQNGIWPCEPVRQVLDGISSRDMADGMVITRYNLRGAHLRGDGGQSEREFAEVYRRWAKATVYRWPFTARLLEHLAQAYDEESVYHDTDAKVRRRIN